MARIEEDLRLQFVEPLRYNMFSIRESCYKTWSYVMFFSISITSSTIYRLYIQSFFCING